MSFLHPLLLIGLPLVALPIIIHLINQRRYQSIRWGAMMFLLAANRMSRGYSRLRQWLIMAMRMLAIAGLIFAISRPLASGWLGLTAGGRPDTTIVLLDRSPSMQQSGAGAAQSKLEAARRQLSQTLGMLGPGRLVLIENTMQHPIELDSAEALVQSAATESVSASADLPAMLGAAHDYIAANQSGRTEIWICSDLRENDWNSDSGRWQTLRETFGQFPQSVRFYLLAYPQTPESNLALRVTDVRRQVAGDGADLLVSLRIVREGATPGGAGGRQTIPIQFEIDGARSELSVEMEGAEFTLKEHRIPIEKTRQRGWGRVSIPADANLADNQFFFVFDQPAPRKTIVVADEPQSAQPLRLAAAVGSDPKVPSSAEAIDVDQLANVEWDQIALVLWQAALPEGDSARLIQEFVERGGRVIFFPPRSPTSAEMFGVRWETWVESPQEVPVDNWRGDADLLSQTQSGAPLPVGKLEIRGYCKLAGELTPLAVLRGGAPLLARVATNRGGVYFCATTPAAADSSLANNGVVLYVLVQRAIADGAAVLGTTRQLVAGEAKDDDATTWQGLAAPEGALSTEYPFHQGAYEAGERLLAVNRAAAEDQAPVLVDRRVEELFRGLDFSRVDDQADGAGSLVQEIWRMFLIAMIVAMLFEAVLCLSRPVRSTGGAA
ncbi:MAG TPA: BatA domain-containing protein [Pirellulales bacterium]